MGENELLAGRILIVDDEPGNVRVLERVLSRAGFHNLRSFTDSREAIQGFREFQPDLVLLDLKMPFMDGFAVMEELKAIEPDSFLSILVLTAQRDQPTRLRALKSGARDFLSKPFEMTEALTRIRNMLEVSLLHSQVRDQNRILEDRVRERTRDLENTRLEVAHRLARAAEYRDNETGMHVIRMSRYCARLAHEIGLSRDECELLLNASPMHDVGKIGIPDHILLKKGRLSPEEWKIMKLHPTIGAEILSGSNSKLMKMAEIIALTHQERWDGSGYPKGLKGEEIPLVGRIVAICDVFDALTSERPYKPAFSVEKSLEIIENESDGDFDPQLVEAFKRIVPDLVDIMNQFPDSPDIHTLKVYHAVNH